MRASACEVDTSGLRHLLPEDFLLAKELDRLGRVSAGRPAAVVRALLEEPDAEDLRAEVGAGRHREACGLPLNRAVELIAFAAATPGLTPA